MNCRSAEAVAGLPPEIRQVELAPDGDGEIVPHSLPPSNVSEHEATTAASIILESMQRSCGDEQQASAPMMLQQCNSSLTTPVPTITSVYDQHGHKVIVPEVGMCFESEDDAYNMYNAYAKAIGFSIRKSDTKRRTDKTIYQKYIVCSNQGKRGKHSSHETLKENDNTRTSCDARVQFSICRKGIWRVQKVVLKHNHYLSSPNKTPMLRSHRRIIPADRHLIGQIREAGIRPAQIWDFFKQWYGGSENVPFQRVDCNNEIGRERK
ncbi:hypothetical protein EJB05_30566, partial [Eragrostis curvula]